jgi:hypothetical protein
MEPASAFVSQHQLADILHYDTQKSVYEIYQTTLFCSLSFTVIII